MVLGPGTASKLVSGSGFLPDQDFSFSEGILRTSDQDGHTMRMFQADSLFSPAYTPTGSGASQSLSSPDSMSLSPGAQQPSSPPCMFNYNADHLQKMAELCGITPPPPALAYMLWPFRPMQTNPPFILQPPPPGRRARMPASASDTDYSPADGSWQLDTPSSSGSQLDSMYLLSGAQQPSSPPRMFNYNADHLQKMADLCGITPPPPALAYMHYPFRPMQTNPPFILQPPPPGRRARMPPSLGAAMGPGPADGSWQLDTPGSAGSAALDSMYLFGGTQKSLQAAASDGTSAPGSEGGSLEQADSPDNSFLGFLTPPFASSPVSLPPSAAGLDNLYFGLGTQQPSPGVSGFSPGSPPRASGQAHAASQLDNTYFLPGLQQPSSSARASGQTPSSGSQLDNMYFLPGLQQPSSSSRASGQTQSSSQLDNMYFLPGAQQPSSSARGSGQTQSSGSQLDSMYFLSGAQQPSSPPRMFNYNADHLQKMADLCGITPPPPALAYMHWPFRAEQTSPPFILQPPPAGRRAQMPPSLGADGTWQMDTPNTAGPAALDSMYLFGGTQKPLQAAVSDGTSAPGNIEGGSLEEADSQDYFNSFPSFYTPQFASTPVSLPPSAAALDSQYFGAGTQQPSPGVSGFSPGSPPRASGSGQAHAASQLDNMYFLPAPQKPRSPPRMFNYNPAHVQKMPEVPIPLPPITYMHWPIRLVQTSPPFILQTPPPGRRARVPTPAQLSPVAAGPAPVLPTYPQTLAQTYSPALVRRNRPPPLHLPPPGAVTPDYSPQRLPTTPYFTYYSPPALVGPRPGAQAKEAPPKTPEGAAKERRGADRHAMSISSTKPPKDPKQVTMERIVGEIAFQLDRRILSNIFPDRVRLYGFNVSDIHEKIAQIGSDTQSGLTEEQRTSLMERYKNLMTRLKSLGYDQNIHPSFTEQIVNTYGILRERPDMTGTEGDVYNDVEFLRNVVRSVVPANKCDDCLKLLNCLHLLSQEDGKPLFIW